MKTKWMVCPICRGEGKTVNPDIDSNGLTRDDFYDDPDFAQDYVSGVYDISCRACEGKRVVTKGRIKELERNAADRRLAAREDGDWEGFCGAGDYRYG